MEKHAQNLEFEAWLKKPANSHALDRLVKAIHKTMQKRMLFLRGMNPMLMTSDEFQEELKQECLVVLLKDRSMLAELMGRKPLGERGLAN